MTLTGVKKTHLWLFCLGVCPQRERQSFRCCCCRRWRKVPGWLRSTTSSTREAKKSWRHHKGQCWCTSETGCFPSDETIDTFNNHSNILWLWSSKWDMELEVTLTFKLYPLPSDFLTKMDWLLTSPSSRWSSKCRYRKSTRHLLLTISAWQSAIKVYVDDKHLEASLYL